MADDVSMVFFASSAACPDLNGAARLLAEQGLDVAADGQALVVQWEDDGPALRIRLSAAPHVNAEAIEIAEGTAHAAGMSRCNARFEIDIDDLDETLDEINTLIEVQATLQDATDGYLFNSWNGELSAPDSSRA